MKKKNIIVILIILAACALFYFTRPEKGSFNELIMSKYRAENFIEININCMNSDNIDLLICKDKNKINEFISYLKTLKLVEAQPAAMLNGAYDITIVNEVKNADGYIHDCEQLSMTVFENNMNFIEIFSNGEIKTYKITNGRFDMKYIQGIIKSSYNNSENLEGFQHNSSFLLYRKYV